MKNLKISIKFISGFTLVAILALFLGYTGSSGIQHSGDSIENIAGVSLPGVEALGRLRYNYTLIGAYQNALFLKGADRTAVYAAISEARAAYLKAMEDYEKLPKSSEAAQLWEKYKKSLDEHRVANGKAFEHMKKWEQDSSLTAEYDQALHLVLTDVARIQAASMGALGEVITLNLKNSKAARDKATAQNHHDGFLMNCLMVIIPLLSLLTGLFLARGVSGPLKKAVAMANSLAAGDLSARLGMQRKDEIGALAASLDAMAGTLMKLKTNIVDVARQASAGYLRKTIDDTGFAGDYKGLIASVNQWAGNMLLVIDKTPSPIMIRDKDRTMRFLSQAGGLGLLDPHAAEGRKCDRHFNTEDCQNGRCACDSALRSGQEETSATVARPTDALTLDIEYRGIPFGEDAVFEFVTDQTAVMRTQRTILDIANQADGVSANVASASEEISAQVEQSTSGAQEQARRISETATAMEQMNATVLEVAKSASQAAGTSEKAKTQAQAGAQVVAQVVTGIGQVQANALELKTSMTELGAQAEGIGQVMNVISDIADQTNLLALNAAIEAARAGEAGRGFAVVADEVRKLAEKTMTATKEVGEAINGIQEGTRRNISSVGAAGKAVEEATALASTSGEALREIVTLVEHACDQVRSIAAASEQQSAASEEINRSIEAVNRISSETSEAMAQSAMAVGELSNQALILKNLIEEMKGGGAGNGQKALA